MSKKTSQQKEKRHWAIDMPKLDNARKLRDIYYIDPYDMEFNDTMKNARKKLEVPLESAMPCTIAGKHEETRGAHDSSRKTRYACIIEAHISTRTRIGATQPRDHEDRIAERRLNSLTHYNLVHKPIPIPQAMKISDAKAAVDKEWEMLEKMPAWQVTKVKSKTEVIQKAQKGGTFHFASLMDLCHLKNLELEQQKKKVVSCSEVTL